MIANTPLPRNPIPSKLFIIFFSNPNFAKTLNSKVLWSPLNIKSRQEMKNDNLCLLDIKGSHSSGYSMNTTCGFIKERMHFWSSRKLNENFDGLN